MAEEIDESIKNTNINLDKIRQKIETMNKENHIEIAKLLKEKNIKLTENNNGIFINLTNLSEENIQKFFIELIEKYQI